jgi:hypothetical protein
VEQNLKNASSWSSLAQSSPPTITSNPPTAAALKSSMADSFQAFKKQAKENAKKVNISILYYNQYYIMINYLM